MVLGLEHTAIASPDPQKLAHWYVEQLGFVINYDSGRTVFVKAPNGSMLEIITSEGERQPQTMKDPGIRHLALAVDDFDATYQQLKAGGAAFLAEPVSSKGVRVVFFTDPDGNILHLIQRETPP
ncbi:MAG TPA: VOC family protein [Bryobacteraceae bacterium]|nr:VOC family protein [Bryobacteraceae bacterium]